MEVLFQAGRVSIELLLRRGRLLYLSSPCISAPTASGFTTDMLLEARGGWVNLVVEDLPWPDASEID
eukprot:5844470-Pyramimonas_sp.AAC.1